MGSGGGGGKSSVPTYPNMFSADQLVNAYSDWNNRKYETDYLGTPTDALGRPIPITDPAIQWKLDRPVNQGGPPGGYDVPTGDLNAMQHGWGYIQAMANPGKVPTYGNPIDVNKPPAMVGAPSSFSDLLEAYKANKAQNAPGYTPAASAVPGVTLGGGSSNVFSGNNPLGGGTGFLDLLSQFAGKGSK